MSAKEVVCTGDEIKISECKIVDYTSPPYNAGGKIWCNQIRTDYQHGKFYEIREMVRNKMHW